MLILGGIALLDKQTRTHIAQAHAACTESFIFIVARQIGLADDVFHLFLAPPARRQSISQKCYVYRRRLVVKHRA
jgi:hypothetical protein